MCAFWYGELCWYPFVNELWMAVLIRFEVLLIAVSDMSIKLSLNGLADSLIP